MRKPASILGIWLIAAVLCSAVYAQESPISATNNTSAAALDRIIERMESAQLQAKPTIPYQVTREYRLFGEKNPNPTSEVLAELDYLPPSHKSYVIHQRIGSSRGEDVVRRILQHESQMGGGKSLSGAAIDRNNYSFSYLGKAILDGHACYVLGLNPKRKETELVRGSAWVDQSTFLVRHIEGVMAKNPSWILKKVELKIDFADLGGAWLQTAMRAVADLHFIGTQTLESRTVQAQIGEVVAEKSRPAVRTSIRRSSRRGMSATVIVPFEPDH